MSKKVLVPLARGFEEIEFVSIVDILRRAELEVLIASLDDEKQVSGAHNIKLLADCALSSLDLNDFDAIALAGGYEGMMNLKNNALILATLKKFKQENKLVSAICASPIVLHEAGVLQGNFTCYPGCEKGLNGFYENKAVLVNKNLITSAGPGTASKFALELVRYLCGEEKYKKLYDELLMYL